MSPPRISRPTRDDEDNTTIMALSLWQPWASLLAGGVKPDETRNYATKYRGWLLIQAGLAMPDEAYWSYREPLFRNARRSLGLPKFDDLPRGCYVGMVYLHEVVRSNARVRFELGDRIAFGGYDDGRSVWRCRWPRLFREPIPAKGNQFIWQPDRSFHYYDQLPTIQLPHDTKTYSH